MTSSAERDTGRGRSSGSRSRKEKVEYGFFVPLFGLAFTLVVMAAFETTQLLMTKDGIATVKNNQNSAVDESQKMRAQFDSIVKGTVQLAGNGNISAAKIVRQLEQQGVTISRNSETAP